MCAAQWGSKNKAQGLRSSFTCFLYLEQIPPKITASKWQWKESVNVSYKQLKLCRRVIPTRTNTYKRSFCFCQREFSIIFMVNLVKCLWQTIVLISTPYANRVWAELPQYLGTHESWIRSLRCVHSPGASLFDKLRVQGKLPSDLGTNCTGDSLPWLTRGRVSWSSINAGCFCGPAPHLKMFIGMWRR